MTLAAILFLVALLVELALLANTILTVFKERGSLARFVRAAADPERLKDVAMQLPGAYRAPATQFAGELARKGPLDEIVTQAVTKTANTSFAMEPLQRFLFGLAMAIIVYVPLSATLIVAAISIEEARSSTQMLNGSIVFLQAKDKIDPAFGELHWAFQGSALLLAGLIVIACTHWWLARPEVREARFVKALLEAAIGARPGASAPVAGRLSQLLAPDRSLGAPIAAFVFFFVALAGGWFLLSVTAGVKEANAADVYNVWPKNSRPVVPQPGLDLCTLEGGGSPVRELANLQVGPREIKIADAVWIEDLGPSYALSDRFPADAPSLDLTLAKFKDKAGEMDLNALVHRDVPMQTVLSLFSVMHNKQKVRHAYLVFSRGILAPADAKTSGRPQQISAAIPLLLTRPDTKQALVSMEIDKDKVVIDPTSNEGVQIDKSEPAWKLRLASALRERSFARKEDNSPPFVAVRPKSGAVTYEQMIEALAAADSTCPAENDCGVPGLGFRFYLDK